MTMRIEELAGSSHERAVRGFDEDTGLDAIIAIHDTKRGPALGGCRIRRFDSMNAHLEEALALSKSMTFKNEAAGLKHGGGKSVINYNGTPTHELLESFAILLNYVNKDGHIYTTAGDMGTGPRELGIISASSKFCYYRHTGASSGETTAYGVFIAIEALTDWRTPVNIEGVGKVGASLAHFLKGAGHHVRVADVNDQYAKRFAKDFGFEHVALDKVKFLDGVYAPCAIGGTVDKEFLEHSKAQYVIGGANNQLATGVSINDLVESEREHVTDYVANMGGVVHIALDIEYGLPDRVGIHNPLVKKHLEDRMHIYVGV